MTEQRIADLVQELATEPDNENGYTDEEKAEAYERISGPLGECMVELRRLDENNPDDAQEIEKYKAKLKVVLAEAAKYGYGMQLEGFDDKKTIGDVMSDIGSAIITPFRKLQLMLLRSKMSDYTPKGQAFFNYCLKIADGEDGPVIEEYEQKIQQLMESNRMTRRDVARTFVSLIKNDME